MSLEKYEISVWDSEFVAAADNVPAYYKDVKIAVIGSDDMEAPYKAIDPLLVSNINGTHTLTFKMPYHYIDNYTGEEQDNPFMKLLVNERRVKAYWKSQWYDLVIKQKQETTDKKMMTFTCQDLFINELSKNGFKLSFDPKLNNSFGTVKKLGKQIVDGTDWIIDENSDLIQQLNKEDTYQVTTSNKFNAHTTLPADTTLSTDTVEIPAEASILVFYSCVDEGTNFLQFWYDPKGYDTNSTDRSVQETSTGHAYWVEAAYSEVQDTDNKIKSKWTVNDTTNNTIEIVKIDKTDLTALKYRANRPVRTQEYEYNKELDKLVGCYKKASGNTVYYCDKITKYYTPFVVTNLIANHTSFINTDGWTSTSSINIKYKSDSNSTRSFLPIPAAKVVNGTLTSGTLTNNTIRNMLQYTNHGFTKGSKYRLRFKIVDFVTSGTTTTISPRTNLGGLIVKVIAKEISSSVDTAYWLATASNTSAATLYYDNITGYVSVDMPWLNSISDTQIQALDSFNLVIKNESTTEPYLEDIQFYPLIPAEKKDTYLEPNDFTTSGEGNNISTPNVIHTYYHYFKKGENEENIYLAESYDNPISEYIISYTNDFEKVRSIFQKESNRFNLLQSLAESFSCWVRFTIEHEDNGAIKINNGVPQKLITFKKDIGVDNGLVFEYGQDLKSVERTVNSDQITTSLIVKDNVNSLANNGICSIMDASLNPSGTTTILNFDYYINHELLKADDVNNLLYNSNGLYAQLRATTREIIDLSLEYQGLLREYDTLKGYAESYKAALDSIKKQEENVGNYPDSDDKTNKLNNLKIQKKQYEDLLATVSSEKLASIQNIIKNKETAITTKTTSLNALWNTFNKQMSYFIQEGTWNSNEYIDPNQYYLAALDVSFTSSMPQTSYQFSVARINDLPGFESKVLRVGDICYAQDREFFGSRLINGVETPNKERVMISEMKEYFEQPQNDEITVQNYRTQFEDLFQRIAASSQSLQFHEGDYNRAANSVDSTGAVTYTALQDAFTKNEQFAMISQNQTIVKDASGVTVTDLANNAKKARLNASGLAITADGGTTWKNAVTGEGITTDLLTAGAINAGKISVYSDFGDNTEETKLNLTGNGISLVEGSNTKFLLGKETANDTVKLKINLSKTVGTKQNSLEIGDINEGNDSYFIKGVKNGKTTLVLSQDGDATFNGEINSEAGNIGGWEITEDSIRSETMTIRQGSENTSSTWKMVYYSSTTNGTVNVKIKNTSTEKTAYGVLSPTSAMSETLIATYLSEYAISIYSLMPGEIAQVELERTNTGYMGLLYDSSKTPLQTAIDSKLTVLNLNYNYIVFPTFALSTNVAKPIISVHNSKEQTFEISRGGILRANNASITGSITATSGTIGGPDVLTPFTISSTKVHINSSSDSDSDSENGSDIDVPSIYTHTAEYAGSAQFGIKADSHVYIGGDGFSYWDGKSETSDYNTAIRPSFVFCSGNSGLSQKQNAAILYGNNRILFYYGGLTNLRTASNLGNSVGTNYLVAKIEVNSDNISISGAVLTTAPSAVTSDRNAKNSIASISDKYSDLFDNLRPCVFKYNNGTSGRFHIGFVAQEVKDAIEAANMTTQDFAGFIQTQDEDKLCALRYEEFIALNTQQIQKLKNRVNTLEEENQTLQLKIDSLEQRLAALEQKLINQ